MTAFSLAPQTPSNALSVQDHPPQERRGIVLVTDWPELADMVGTVAAAAAMKLSVISDVTEWTGPRPLAWLMGVAPADMRGRRHRASSEVWPPTDHTVYVVAPEPVSLSAWAEAEHHEAAPVVLLPSGGPWLVRRLLRDAASGDGGRVIGVVSAAGGLGSTSLTALVGMHAVRRGMKTLVVEGNPHGFGLYDAMGLDTEGDSAPEGVQWRDFTDVKGLLNPEEFARMLPTAQGVSVLGHRSPWGQFPAHEAVSSVMTAARSAYDLVLVDMGQSFWHPNSLTPFCDDYWLMVSRHPVTMALGLRLAYALEQDVVTAVVASPRRGAAIPSSEVVAHRLEVDRSVAWPYRPAVAQAGDLGTLPALGGERWLAVLCRTLLPLEVADSARAGGRRG
jgi:hypothetical protein